MAEITIGPPNVEVIAELTLAPSGDEILPVRSQEPADQCISDEKQINQIPSVPLGMESD